MTKIITEKEARRYSPNVLAFYGDSVYEMLVRNKIVAARQTNAGALHTMAVERGRASYQSAAVEVIKPLLTEAEANIRRRGPNAGGISTPKSPSASEYRRATALETLFGYLSLTGQFERLSELFEAICEALPIKSENSEKSDR